jgi:signal transduction histidine kinase
MDPESQSADREFKEREERINLLMLAEEMQAVLSVQQAISSRLDPDDVLQMIADEARRLTKSEMSAVFLFKADHFEISVVSGEVGKDLLGWQIPLNSSIAGRAVAEGKSFLIRDTEQASPIYTPLVEKVAARSLVIVPLMSGDEAKGTITVANRTPNSLSENDQRLLTMLAPGAVIALDNARHYEQAQQAAALEERQRLARELHDAVTQTLFSASLIADVLPRIWQRCPQEGTIRLEELRNLTRGALAEMRSLLMELHPSALIEQETEELLQQLCDAFTARTLIPVFLQQTGACEPTEEVKVSLYRITQDVLTHIGRHSSADRVDIELCCLPGEVNLTIAGNGSSLIALDETAGQAAIKIIKERALHAGARVQVSDRPGGGSIVFVRWQDQNSE